MHLVGPCSEGQDASKASRQKLGDEARHSVQLPMVFRKLRLERLCLQSLTDWSEKSAVLRDLYLLAARPIMPEPCKLAEPQNNRALLETWNPTLARPEYAKWQQLRLFVHLRFHHLAAGLLTVLASAAIIKFQASPTGRTSHRGLQLPKSILCPSCLDLVA